MNQDPKAAFWKGRLATHGHTGWSDPVIYAFDQLERLALMHSVISRNQMVNGAALALDFGCGTGDFSRMLLGLGFTVCGYDPFVDPEIRSRQFTYADSQERIPFGNQTVDVALSITTLDHILDEGELLTALRAIHRRLKEGGRFYLLEYAPDSDADRAACGLRNDYQSFRTLAQWESLLQACSFGIVDIAAAPHPHLNPSPGYLAYLKHPLVRFRRRCDRLPLTRHWYDRMLRRSAARLLEKFPASPGARSGSPLKLIQCSRMAH